MPAKQPHPTGWCFCGCGAKVSTGKFFVPGCAIKARSTAIRNGFGSIAALAQAHIPGAGKPRNPAPAEPAPRDRKLCSECNHPYSLHRNGKAACSAGCGCRYWRPTQHR